MHIEHFIANRYLIAKKVAGTSLITKVAIIGLILTVSSIITVLSVMNGFHEELRSRVLSSISHGYIASIGGFKDIASVQKIINAHPQVIASNQFIEQYGLISYGNNAEGISVRGIDTNEKQTTNIWQKFKGNKNLGSGDIIIGVGLATQLGATINDKVSIITPKLNTSLFGTTPSVKRFRVSGIFDGGVSEYDNNLAFISLTDAQALYKMHDIDGVRIKVRDIFSASTVINELSATLGDNYYGISWQEQKKNFFTALKLEKHLMMVILAIIIIVAVFNVVSMMVMLVKDKKYDIAILRTFGFSARQVKKVMWYLGLKIGLFAIGLGVILGLLLSYFISPIVDGIETLFQTQFFPDDVFYISSLPSQILVTDILLVVVTSFIFVMISSIYPAATAAKINISETLKEL